MLFLPDELKIYVCQYLDIDEVRNIRLVSKLMNYYIFFLNILKNKIEGYDADAFVNNSSITKQFFIPNFYDYVTSKIKKEYLSVNLFKSDIEDLSNLLDVYTVRLVRCNQIIDISPLKNARNLFIYSCMRVKMDTLGESKVTNLIISYGYLGSLNFLKKCKNLRTLIIDKISGYSNIPFNLDCIKYVYNLEKLDFSYSKIKSCTLTNIKSILKVVIHGSFLKDDDLKYISHIENIDLSRNYCITQVCNLYNVKNLILKNCIKLVNVCNLSNLEYLDISNNEKIINLLGVPKLKELDMTRCINLDLSNIEYINTIKYILNDPYDIGKFKTPIEEREFNNKCSKLIVEKKEVFPFIMPQNIYLRNIKIKEYLEKNQNPINRRFDGNRID